MCERETETERKTRYRTFELKIPNIHYKVVNSQTGRCQIPLNQNTAQGEAIQCMGGKENAERKRIGKARKDWDTVMHRIML